MADEEIWVCSMAYIQVTTRCNMFCEHCGFSCTAEGEDMSMEVFERTLQVFEGSYITIGGGEPTLHPKIFEMVLIAMSQPYMEIPVFMVTNGSNDREALLLAQLSKNAPEAFSCRLSVDYYHEPISPQVRKAFEGMHNSVSWVRPSGRAVENQIYTDPPFGGYDDSPGLSCFCDDWIVKPNGDVYHCGCGDSPKVGNVLSERSRDNLLDKMRMEDEHTCWKSVKKKRRKELLNQISNNLIINNRRDTMTNESGSKKKSFGAGSLFLILISLVIVLSFMNSKCNSTTTKSTPSVSTENVKVEKMYLSKTIGLREEFAQRLRNNYLDNGLDIKVILSGKYKQKMTLKYPLFSDVWVHKLKQGDIIDTVIDLGFDYLEVNDGYDYAVYWTFKPTENGYIIK